MVFGPGRREGPWLGAEGGGAGTSPEAAAPRGPARESVHQHSDSSKSIRNIGRAAISLRQARTEAARIVKTAAQHIGAQLEGKAPGANRTPPWSGGRRHDIPPLRRNTKAFHHNAGSLTFIIGWSRRPSTDSMNSFYRQISTGLL